MVLLALAIQEDMQKLVNLDVSKYIKWIQEYTTQEQIARTSTKMSKELQSSAMQKFWHQQYYNDNDD